MERRGEILPFHAHVILPFYSQIIWLKNDTFSKRANYTKNSQIVSIHHPLELYFLTNLSRNIEVISRAVIKKIGHNAVYSLTVCLNR